MSSTSKEVDATQAKIYCHCFRLTHWIQSWQLSSNENVYITEAASTIIVREMASFFFFSRLPGKITELTQPVCFDTRIIWYRRLEIFVTILRSFQ